MTVLFLCSLIVDDNLVSGGIPKLSSSLRLLHLGENRLSGKLSSDIASLSNLEILTVNGNIMTGRLPTELGLLGALEELELSRNKFDGPVPTEMGLMESLVVSCHNYLFRENFIFSQ